jgi:hypothetical protein
MTGNGDEHGDKSVTYRQGTRRSWRYSPGESFFADFLVIGLVLGACYVVGTILQEALNFLGVDLFQ